jgi:thiamine biosynthesis lipoprotein
VQWSFVAIGTTWTIDLYDISSESLAQEIADRIEQFDRTYSRFRSDSEVTHWSQVAGTYSMPADGQKLFSFYRQLYDLTAGAVTPLIGRTLSDVGYDSSYSLTPKPNISSTPAWEDILLVGGTTITIHRPALLDFGAAGKGYLVDIVARLLDTAGVARYTIDAGGDIYYHSDEPLSVALENPVDTSQAIGIAQLTTGAICGSAGNRRSWAGYHHIIDPRTVVSPRHLQAVWVAAESAILADGLATALYFVDPPVLSTFQFSYALVHTDGSYTASPDFPGHFFTMKE